jgi:predicted lipoprotein
MAIFFRENRMTVARATASLWIVCAAAAGCRLWTIRPIESQNSSKAQPSAAASQAFDAGRYVDSIWESKLAPVVMEKAVDLPALLTALEANAGEAERQYGVRDGDGPAHFLVKGEGVVVRADADSPRRTLTLRLPKYAGKTEVSVQIGPVFRGTSVRDAVGFIRFDQFANQLQYAEVAAKLNDRVFTMVAQSLDPAAMQGKSLSFHAAFTRNESGEIVLTPVRLEWGGTR